MDMKEVRISFICLPLSVSSTPFIPDSRNTLHIKQHFDLRGYLFDLLHFGGCGVVVSGNLT